jgi:FAD/FMN-containing dehydrogenase
MHTGQTAAALAEDVIGDFGARLRGDLIRPADARYDAARAVWNAMMDCRPAMIAMCVGTADVVQAVSFARAHGLELSIRSGGHHVSGSAIVDGGLVIDLSRMRGIRVDRHARLVRAESGSVWSDLDQETQAFGMATPGAIV